MELGHLVDYSIRHVSPEVNFSAIGGDGEEMCRAIQSTDCYPTTVPADPYVLDTCRGGPSEQSVEVMDSRLPTHPRVRDEVEDIEGMALCTGSHQQTSTTRNDHHTSDLSRHSGHTWG